MSREKAKEILYDNMSDNTAKHINDISFLEDWIIDAMIEYNESIVKSNIVLAPVIKSQIFLVNYYCNGAQSIEGAFSSQDLADKWISKQTDNIPYCTLVAPIDFL